MDLRKQIRQILESHPVIRKYIFRKYYYDITKEIKSVEKRYIKKYGDNPSDNIKLFRKWFMREYRALDLDKI